jgi:hypothetical protein
MKYKLTILMLCFCTLSMIAFTNYFANKAERVITECENCDEID